MIDDGTELLTIGELARATGLTVRTIRYWSDEGVLPPATRSAGGYRLYDAEGAARLELIRTLRELGLGLDDVRKVLAGETTVAEVAAAHVLALDARIRALRVTRAVLSTVARRGSTAEEMTLMHKLARLSAAERRRIMEEFVDELFHGLDTVDPCVERRMRGIAVDLPDDPSPEQVDAWVELAEMVRDPEFRKEMRKVMEFNAADQDRGAVSWRAVWFPMRLVQLGGEALRRGVDPGSPEAASIVREVLGEGGDPAVVLERMESASNNRLARYRELLSTVKGSGPAGAHREEFAWVVAALRARAAG
ncbi:MerR family transcriptional regulator [Streptomyces sp. NPDC101175]|uniref:helix-turn-helix domain-containing protein n=1 Tax=Streptomyces sp. NPDC101175 TaxID=3366123 RepID=UPI0038342474